MCNWKLYCFSLFLLQLWRASESEFQFRTSEGQFLTCDGGGCSVSATAKSPSTSETYGIERNGKNRIHLKIKGGAYLQVLILLISTKLEVIWLHVKNIMLCFHKILLSSC